MNKNERVNNINETSKLDRGNCFTIIQRHYIASHITALATHAHANENADGSDDGKLGAI
jgi:hypothetical protein